MIEKLCKSTDIHATNLKKVEYILKILLKVHLMFYNTVNCEIAGESQCFIHRLQRFFCKNNLDYN